MPDWEQINQRKRKEINLGMAKNAAISFLKDIKPEERAAKYKQTAKALFKLNEELDKELLNVND